MKQTFSLIALIAAFPAFAEDTRELDAHEHGVGTLNIATDGTTVAMVFEAPGADIVGFEYAAESDIDLAAIVSAVATLGAPLDLFVMPDAAGCTLVEAQAALEGEDEHDEHSEEHHDDHADEGHDDHGDEDHAEHADEAGHTEFHAEYTLTCDDPDALTDITFAYFEAFPNAQEVEVQVISASGAQAFEVTRDAPVLDLGR
ncbi:zinc uptake protein ZrgA [Falsihalocynthiibacter arcticus]|uniref:zinc uptake protein ZrgA n=1 Tax=Falsihalocynthiibacter arcticus TaxID=1579316 RepID=UPI003002D851